ncbi:MAG: serine dehydratase [Ignavibacteria bacterium GWF2_33_9]|nr:MAG: serine dehydratase [Ignavibacteria bacterium GWF2_33_9]
MNKPIFKDIEEAHRRISEFIHRTPVLTCKSLDTIVGANLYFKCENFQKVGAFKFRGATNAVQLLTDEEMSKGVVTHSSGNHAQALALAAKMRKIKAYIIMPSNAPKSKVEAVKGYGGNVIFCEPTLVARETTTQKVIDETGAKLIHPYDNFNIIAGQGTAAKELIEDVGFMDIIMAPVGGGGLLSGTSISAKELLPHAKVIAAEPKNADDAFQSFYSKSFIPSVNPNTIADGLKTSLSDLTFSIILEKVDEILPVKEDTIAEAMKLIWQRMKIIIEPSSAVPLAAIMENPEVFANKKVGIILSGGNLDFDNLPFN